MNLVERDEILADFAEDLRSATAVSGRVVVLEGESGVGKTSVLRALARSAPEGVRLLWGSCDALATPRPLGPLLDMASQGARHLAAELAVGAKSHTLFGALLADLRTPSFAVIEDVHWADEATLDLIRFIGRRIDQTQSLLAVSLRDDEVGPDHPVRAVLGDLATAPTHRRRLASLSAAGVGRMAAGRPVDAERLFQVTGGNPFYVTEVLAAPDSTVPPSVRDAVIARMSRLPGSGRAPLEAVSIDPGPVERSVLRAMGIPDVGVSVALDHAMLVREGERLRFRHELARLAIADGIPYDRRAQLHEQMLMALESVGVQNPARMAHHASGTGDPRHELRWAMLAAEEAAAAGAHREATAQYAKAIRHVALLPASKAIDLLERYAELLVIVDQPAAAVEAWSKVVSQRADTDDRIGLAVAEAMYARALWTAGRGDEAYPLIARTTEQLEGETDVRIALAFATRGYLAMLARRSEEAVHWAQRAIALEPGRANDSTLPMALNALGSARIVGYEDMGGIDDLVRSRDVAARVGSRRYVAAAYTNLGSGLGEIRRYEPAADYLEQGIAYATEEDLDFTRHYCIAWLARVRFEQGRWIEAERLAEQALGDDEISPISPIVALTIQGRVRTRRGEEDAEAPLERAWHLAEQTGDIQRLWPTLAARAEALWFREEPSRDLEADLRRVIGLARDKNLRWAVGELAFWNWRLGLGEPALEGAAEPYADHARGSHAAAAAAWERIGCPYEAAWARADSGEEASMRLALDTLMRLGAGPLADRLRRDMRAKGISGIPTGPRRTTDLLRGGLTVRERQVLALLAEGLTDREIAERLFLSPKTASHHVSAILAKLDVRSRTEAASRAVAMGWFEGGQSGSDP